MLESLKVSFLVLHFSYYTLMTFLMLSVILLSILILISILSVIRHLICANKLDSELESIYKTLWTGAGSGFLISMMEKLNWLHTGTIDVKMDGPVLEEKSSFKLLGLTFSSKLDLHSYIISIAKTASKKTGALWFIL